MSNSTIGIKIANGEFFPILDDQYRGIRKKLVLTTVKDNQESVQIDLYRGEGKSLSDASYIGSLVVENIQPAVKGEKDIDLIIGVDRDGTLNANAGDLTTGERQSLSVSLASLDEGNTYDVPDFELDETLSESQEEDFDDEIPEEASYEEAVEEEPEEELVRENKRIHPLLLVGFVILGLLIIVLIAFLIFKTFQGPNVPPLQAGGSPGTEKAVQQEAEDPIAETVEPAAAAVVEPAEVASGAEESSTRGSPAAEIWYKIEWGDTLWDISYSYYRTPWLYGKIAQDNNIKNPDLIFADSKIRIPSE